MYRIDWTQHEINEVKRLVKEYGRDFKTIAEKLGTRSKDSVISFARNYVLKMDSGEVPADKEFLDNVRATYATYLTQEETKRLIILVKEHG